jgi:hypothetical protein
MIFTRDFWRRAVELATRSAAQSATLALGAGQFNALTVDWATVAGFALGGAFLSFLTSLAATSFGDTDRPTFTD